MPETWSASIDALLNPKRLRVCDRGGGFRTARDVAARFITAGLPSLDREVFCVEAVDSRHRPLFSAPVLVAVGSLTASIVHPRETFRRAVKAGATSIILAHNHPSGDPSPSPEDVELTRRLREAGKVLGIQVLDHVVIGAAVSGEDARWFSFVDSGWW